MFHTKLTEQQKQVISDHYKYVTLSMRKTAAALNVSISTVHRVCKERGIIEDHYVICLHCHRTFPCVRPARGIEKAKLCPSCAVSYATMDVIELKERLRIAEDKANKESSSCGTRT
jgi:hypothetical protein